jgi:hypothetical protein
MNTTTSDSNDSIVNEVRAARDKHAAQFGYDINEIFKQIKVQQQSSGRKYVRYPARPVVATATNTSTE